MTKLSAKARPRAYEDPMQRADAQVLYEALKELDAAHAGMIAAQTAYVEAERALMAKVVERSITSCIKLDVRKLRQALYRYGGPKGGPKPSKPHLRAEEQDDGY